MPGPYAGNEKCQEFVENLKAMREGRGWSQSRLASESHGTVVAMIESFARAPLEEHGAAFDEAFGLRDMFAAKARAVQGESFPEAFKSFPAHEAAADDLYIYEHSVFPGLVQTPRYARAMFGTLPDLTADDVERLVDGRLARQKVLFDEGRKHPRLWALVDEAALRGPVAGAGVRQREGLGALGLSDMS